MRPIVSGTVALLLGVSSAAAQTVNFTIDPTQSVQAISPYIYGINSSTNTALNLTAVSPGGNRWTAYNWTNNASNAGSDYLYENDNYLSSSTTPGAAVQGMLQAAANANQAALITIPINGYVAADESGPVNPSIPPSQSPHFVPEYPTPSADPNPAANHVYQNQFIQWVNTHFPNGFASGSRQPIFISLDNEPDLWSSTHPEVHPNAVTYAELVQDSVAYSMAVKGVSQNALVFGPVNYGWEGYLTLQNAPDSAADNAAINPNTNKAYGDFISYYLAQMKTRQPNGRQSSARCTGRALVSRGDWVERQRSGHADHRFRHIAGRGRRAIASAAFLVGSNLRRDKLDYARLDRRPSHPVDSAAAGRNQRQLRRHETLDQRVQLRRRDRYLRRDRRGRRARHLRQARGLQRR